MTRGRSLITIAASCKDEQHMCQVRLGTVKILKISVFIYIQYIYVYCNIVLFMYAQAMKATLSHLREWSSWPSWRLWSCSKRCPSPSNFLHLWLCYVCNQMGFVSGHAFTYTWSPPRGSDSFGFTGHVIHKVFHWNPNMLTRKQKLFVPGRSK